MTPLARQDRNQDVTAFLDSVVVPGTEGTGFNIGDLNIFATFTRHPELIKPWMGFTSFLLQQGELPARERELLILRTAWNCRADYSWGQHVRSGLGVGITPDEVRAIAADAAAEDPAWSEDDAALLRAADELHAGAHIGDATWSALASRWSEAQLIEICMVVGHYHMAAFTLNSLGVQLEAGLTGFPERP